MPQIDQHAPGAFSWIELSTSDQNGAKNFYTSVFGWSFEDSPMGPTDFYTMFQMEGRNVGAAYTQRGDEVAMGVPPHWNLYIEVKNADDTAKRAAELGGTVLAGPFDVFNYGRMGVISDNQGAAFCIWEPKDHDGFGLRDQHGTFCWADLNVKDAKAAMTFYGGLFSWTFSSGDDQYVEIKNGKPSIGGMPPADRLPPNTPPHWMMYLMVDDCDAAVAKTKEAGGKLFVGPANIPGVGSFAIVADPQGAVFAVFDPKPRS